MECFWKISRFFRHSKFT